MKAVFKGFIDRIVSEPEIILDPLIRVAALLIVAALIWWIYNKVIAKLVKTYGSRPFFEKSTRIFHLIRRAGHYLIIILLGTALLRFFHAPLMERLFNALMIILLTTIANNIVQSALPYLERKLVARTGTHMDDVILNLFKRFSGVIIYITGIIIALDVMGLNVMPFIAGAGIAGFAIGFAAKDTLSNLISGVLLIIDRPLKVGDRIEVWRAPKNSATWGDVVDIGLRATKIRTTDNIVIIIPNNEIMNRDIVNYTTLTDEIRVRIPIGISYDANVKKAKEIINRVALELAWVMKDPGPKVVVRSFGESSVDLQARVWINDPRRRIDTISYITDRVKERFDEEGIEIPYPKREIIIKREIVEA
ncbi:MAG: mechanosensitive ion channel family protein [Deltaproteobacteria bacterium]|nr:mechanosensitive ion channel family protein [Deltaproteobacteria bacterium]